jgi:hypothetical protein
MPCMMARIHLTWAWGMNQILALLNKFSYTKTYNMLNVILSVFSPCLRESQQFCVKKVLIRTFRTGENYKIKVLQWWKTEIYMGENSVHILNELGLEGF